MNGELPRLPSSSPPVGLWFPVARWSIPDSGIAYLLELYLDPDPEPGSPVKYDIHVLLVQDDGSWKWSSAGGSDWRFGVSSPPAGSGVWFHSSGVGDPSGSGIFVVPGFAGDQVRSIEVRAKGWTSISSVEEKTGAFLVGARADEPITMTALDGTNAEVGTSQNTTIWDLCNSRDSLPEIQSQWAP
jgi:hypothetical protein